MSHPPPAEVRCLEAAIRRLVASWRAVEAAYRSRPRRTAATGAYNRVTEGAWHELRAVEQMFESGASVALMVAQLEATAKRMDRLRARLGDHGPHLGSKPAAVQLGVAYATIFEPNADRRAQEGR
jgi:hypothetical protein